MSKQQAILKPVDDKTMSMRIEPGEVSEGDLSPKKFACKVLGDVLGKVLTEDEWTKFAAGQIRLDFINNSTPDGKVLSIAVV